MYAPKAEINPIRADVDVDMNKKITGESQASYFLIFKVSKSDKKYAEGVNFYVFENGKILSEYENYSWKMKIKDRIIKTRYFAFPIELKPNQELRVIFSMKEKNGFFYAPITLYEKNWYHEQYDRFNVLYSITK